MTKYNLKIETEEEVDDQIGIDLINAVASVVELVAPDADISVKIDGEEVDPEALNAVRAWQ